MKKDLFTGLAILLPIALTVLVLAFLIHLFTDPFVMLTKSLILYLFPNIDPHFLAITAHAFALVLLALVVLLLGVVARSFFIHTVIQYFQSLLSRIPVVKTIYKVAKDIIAALLSKEGRKAFKHSVLVPFPSKKSFAAGLSSGEVPEEVERKIHLPLEPVFLPTSPHLISGFLIFFPKDRVEKVEMSHQEFVKYIISCGIVVSEKSKKKK